MHITRTKKHVKQRIKPGTKTYHERVPRHGGEKIIEQVGGAQLVHHPVVAIAVDDRLVEVENHDDSSHSLWFLVKCLVFVF
jgi:hypothetical protein